MSDQPTVLVVEDEAAQREVLSYNLEAEGFRVQRAENGEEALLLVEEGAPDVIVLDWMLPNVSGIEVCRQLKMRSETRGVPIIMLSARSEEVDRVRGLETGADDYVVKPYSVIELMARVRAQLRRRPLAATGTEAAPVLRFGEVMVDLARRVVERAGQPLHLTPIEYKLLIHLATQPDRVITHQQLLKAVWGPGHAEDLHYVRVHMANLRKKVEPQPSMPVHLLTEAGVGYRFVP